MTGNRKKIWDVCVVGGGASGMSAAITAARDGASVLVLERMDRTGRKILATGNGRCNLTNNRILAGSEAVKIGYHCGSPEFPMTTLASFDSKDAVTFFGSLGIFTASEGEYVYPASFQAKTVRDALERCLLELPGTMILTETKIVRIVPEHKKSRGRQNGDAGFRVMADDGREFLCRRLILAAGGKSQPKLGSDGSGYTLCRQLGHRILPPEPALCALHAREAYFRRLAGIRAHARVTLFVDGHRIASDIGQIQLTSYGISGIPVFQISGYASHALARKQEVLVRIDFLPEQKRGNLTDFIVTNAAHHPSFTMAQVLEGMLNSTLAAFFTKEAAGGGRKDRAAALWSKDELRRLSSLIHGLPVHITKTNGFDASQVTSGGADVREVDPKTMESRILPGLYITGELLDVDGICGGYNLTWAWATGCLAGEHAAADGKC